MIVQIDQVSNPNEAKRLAEIGVDHIVALIRDKNSVEGVTPKMAKEIFKSLPRNSKGVALTMSTSLEEISDILQKSEPDILHIGSSPEKMTPFVVRELKEKFQNLQIISTIPVIDRRTIDLAHTYFGLADYLILDTPSSISTVIGSTGRTHDWNISREIVQTINIPIILAGGLGPENVAKAIRKVNPAGVDSKSKTDRANGKGKDINKVIAFVKAAKSL